ncbi:hypothetical protein RND71_028844 [Anisodus tanguticus]|uniref:Uncharacterized protein n=1 Tax=Anisodus tanguticus TaxID=243964 RepID=A0AAE1RKI0_9SOLA|nr:hypothetical protein RND71_028844 [Anisodus tanguticus]
MKGSAKPISSPGRTEKFPPPLMRFLKSNVGNKSRGRTRASPMFMRKNNNVFLETSQEPSSPKVTCIGQVRVRRSSKSTATTRQSSSTRKKQQQKKQRKSCCCNIRCKKINIPKSLVSILKKWVRCYCGKRIQTVEVESTQRAQSRVIESTIENVITTTTNANFNNPPKNALLLTRCRSAPYRSSSLASRFWGSPLSSLDDTESQRPQSNVESLASRLWSSPLNSLDTTESQRSQNNVRELEEEKSVLENPISPGSRKSLGSEEMQSSINGGEEEEEEKNGGGDFVHPLLLTRCKSEPARINFEDQCEVIFKSSLGML